MADLKPCPFCGGEAELWRASQGRTAWIACMGKCSVLVSREYKTDAEAISAWNTRADPAAMRAGYELAAAEALEMGVELRRFELAMNDKGEG